MLVCMTCKAWMVFALASGACADDRVVFYDNRYNGTSEFGFEAQIQPAADPFDQWVGDVFPVDQCYLDARGELVVDRDGADPFLVETIIFRVYCGFPGNPEALLCLESTDATFDGVDTYTHDLGVLWPEGELYFVVAAVDEFPRVSCRIFEQTRDGTNTGFLWNPGGGFGYPDDVLPMTEGGAGKVATSPNLVLSGVPYGDNCVDIIECDLADCNGDGAFNVLDFVCYQARFQLGDAGADCNDDGVLNVLDFVCFQTLFQRCSR